MFNEIDFSKIDTSITPPQDDTKRQYYYMAKLAAYICEYLFHIRYVLPCTCFVQEI